MKPRHLQPVGRQGKRRQSCSTRLGLGALLARCAAAVGFGPLVRASSLQGSPKSAPLLPSDANVATSRTGPVGELGAGKRVADGRGRAIALAQVAMPLRLCNAYAYDGSVEVFHLQGRRSGMTYTNSSNEAEHKQRLTEASGPLPYKRCVDVEGVNLVLGSIIEFRIGGDMHIGTFLVNDLPTDGSMLQLALKRRDTWSTAADFSSHVFAAAPGPQVALVDAYLGKAKSTLEFRDVEDFPPKLRLWKKRGAQPRHRQVVNFNTAVEIAPGEHEWLLMGSNRIDKAAIEFKASGRTLYTVLRIGIEAVGGRSFPEELIVWPNEGAVVRRGTADSSGKTLFGIPKDFGKHQRARAVPQTVSAGAVALVVCGAMLMTL